MSLVQESVRKFGTFHYCRAFRFYYRNDGTEMIYFYSWNSSESASILNPVVIFIKVRALYTGLREKVVPKMIKLNENLYVDGFRHIYEVFTVWKTKYG